ncbi:hypothetical protein [Sphingomonas oryzagri]
MNRENIHTENQPKGSARDLSDTLGREGEDVAPGQRQLADDSGEEPETDSKSPLEDPGSPGGTSGTVATSHDQDR